MRIFIVFYLTSLFLYADTDSNTYTALEFKQIFTEIPDTLVKTSDLAFRTESAPVWLGILGSTAILYKYDEDIWHKSEEIGRSAGIGNKDNTKTFVAYKEQALLRLSTDAGSAMYFLGDGWTHLSIAFGHYLYGLNTSNAKATTIGIQLMSGMASSTLINQFLKRATGRESPNMKTVERGRWRPGPSFKTYGEQTASYDAMPSGHIMTATLTFTILRNNYPDQNYWMAPAEYTWLTLLGFQMVNNGVHWASDYPLGIAIGYTVGSVVSQLGVTNNTVAQQKSLWMVFPTYENDMNTINARFTF